MQRPSEAHLVKWPGQRSQPGNELFGWDDTAVLTLPGALCSLGNVLSLAMETPGARQIA